LKFKVRFNVRLSVIGKGKGGVKIIVSFRVKDSFRAKTMSAA
jgi:hypothetical protein